MGSLLGAADSASRSRPEAPKVQEGSGMRDHERLRRACDLVLIGCGLVAVWVLAARELHGLAGLLTGVTGYAMGRYDGRWHTK
jgi:hypothetical protein